MASEAVRFMEWIGLMSFIQFHAFCAMFWSSKNKRWEKWHFWKGVRGFPGQKEVAAAFQAFKIVWVMKARQLGLSELAALYAIYICLTEQKAEVVVISKKRADAIYLLKKRVLPKLQAAYALEQAPGQKFPWPPYVDNSDTGKILFPTTGSWIEAASSDNEEVRSHTPRLVIFDEIRSYLKANAEELWSAILPAIENDPKAQAICISTAKFGTWFNSMTKAIMAGLMEGIHFLFLPDDTNPARHAEWRGKARKKWSDQTLFRREHPLTPEDCFISREGAVWPTFDPKPGGKHINPVKLDFSLRFGITYDHGRQHPAVCLFWLYDTFADHLYIFDEVFCRGMDLPEVCYEIRKKLNFYRKYHNAPDPQIRLADSACFNKDGRQTVADTLRNIVGFSFTPAVKANMDGSIDLVGTRFSQGRMTIDPRCEQTRKQVEDLTWKYEAGETKLEKPVDVEDDAPDCIRYTCVRVRGALKTPKKPETLYEELERKRRHRENYRAMRERITIGDEGGPGAVEGWQAG